MTLMGRIKNSINTNQPTNRQQQQQNHLGSGGRDLGQIGTTGPREQADLGIPVYI